MASTCLSMTLLHLFNGIEQLLGVIGKKLHLTYLTSTLPITFQMEEIGSINRVKGDLNPTWYGGLKKVVGSPQFRVGKNRAALRSR